MRLVDAEQLSKHKYVGVEYDRTDMGIPASAVNVLAYKWGWNDALDSVERFAPTVDAVEVVRCKDCKHYLKSYEKCELVDTRLHFYETDKVWTADCFCAWGDKKDE